ncbi:MAG: cyclopropane-fatty-acyl-phospholipid synthase family protein [Deltaproteobacteria bacterium]|nr:cyclopropane-fatty-acyl-phospholipid synthase family protein [Deltaproteobacteria bacterium]
MSDSIVPAKACAIEETKPSRFDELAKKLLFSLLRGLRWGKLTIIDGTARRVFGEKSDRFPLEATITVHHSRFYSSIVFGGSIGASEAFMAGQWSTDDLTTVVRIIILNREVLKGMEKGLAWLTTPLHLIFHYFRSNTKQGSRCNIAAHYDLGNDFYELFLDETLTYSCGIFEGEDSTLEQASMAKYARICQKLDVSSRDHIVEIGSGWGGFAIYAAKNYGCRITTTTISSAQYDLAKERIAEAGVGNKVELLLEDYRDLRGKYDKLVSIEMIEAVGHKYLDTFFRSCSKLLHQDGTMLLQAITIADQFFDRHRRSVDFIKRYIFPGSCIPSIAAMSRSLARASDLKIFHLEDITPHYARTLRTWRQRFFINIDKVRSLGYPETFIRMWDYYLCYCEAGFTERYLGDVQMLLTKPLCRRPPLLTPLVT